MPTAPASGSHWSRRWLCWRRGSGFCWSGRGWRRSRCWFCRSSRGWRRFCRGWRWFRGCLGRGSWCRHRSFPAEPARQPTDNHDRDDRQHGPDDFVFMHDGFSFDIGVTAFRESKMFVFVGGERENVNKQRRIHRRPISVLNDLSENNRFNPGLVFSAQENPYPRLRVNCVSFPTHTALHSAMTGREHYCCWRIEAIDSCRVPTLKFGTATVLEPLPARALST